MRILMITDVYFPRVNGVSTSIRTFRRELRALGHHVTLIAPAYPQASDDDADIIRVPSRSVPRDPEDRMMRRGDLAKLGTKLSEQRYDIVHVQTPFIAHYAGLSLAKRLHLPVVESYHTFFEEYLFHYVPFVPRGWMRYLARRVTLSQCNAVERVIAPSRAMRNALLEYGVQTPVDILPTGLERSQFKQGDGKRFRSKHGIDERTPVLLYVGRVAHEKNIDFLVRMFRHVLAYAPQAQLLIVGEGPAQMHLRKLVKEIGITNAVQFIGYLERDSELLDCYRAGDLFVFASRTETQGLVLLESLAQGTPVVSTMHMGTRDVLEPAQGARIVPEDEGAFAAVVLRLLNDRAARNELSRLAPSDASKWSSREMAERLVRLYAAAMCSDVVEAESKMTAS